MNKSKGIAACGLACCLCDEHAACQGCAKAGCPDAAHCQVYQCCLEKKLPGCWACPDFPCDTPMLQKPRLRVFCQLTRELGAEQLMELLALREQEGLRYHFSGQIVGDYDVPETEQDIRRLLLEGMPISKP